EKHALELGVGRAALRPARVREILGWRVRRGARGEGERQADRSDDRGVAVYPVTRRRPLPAVRVLGKLLAATSHNNRRARFTESLSGKMRARSGSTRTRFVPAIALL